MLGGATGITKSFSILLYIMDPIKWLRVHVFPHCRFRTAAKAGQDLVFACFDEKSLGIKPE